MFRQGEFEQDSTQQTRMLQCTQSLGKQGQQQRSTSHESRKLSSFIKQSLEPMFPRDSINYGKSRLFFFLPSCDGKESAKRGSQGSHVSRASRVSNAQFAYISSEKAVTKMQRLPRNHKKQKQNKPRPLTNHDARVNTTELQKRQSKSTQKSLQSVHRMTSGGVVFPRTSGLNLSPVNLSPVNPNPNPNPKSPQGKSRILIRDLPSVGKARRSQNVGMVPSGFKKSHHKAVASGDVNKSCGDREDVMMNESFVNQLRDSKRSEKNSNWNGNGNGNVNSPKQRSTRKDQRDNSNSLQRSSRYDTSKQQSTKVRTLPQQQPKSPQTIAKYISLEELGKSQIKLPIVMQQGHLNSPSKKIQLNRIQTLNSCRGTAIEPTPRVEPSTKNKNPKISAYDDLYLSDDFCEMSEGFRFREEQQCKTVAEEQHHHLIEKIEFIQQQLTQQSELREQMNQITKKHEQSNFNLLKGQISQTQLVLSKLLQKTLSRIQPSSFIQTNANLQPIKKQPQPPKPTLSKLAQQHQQFAPQRAGILKLIHIDDQLKDLFERRRVQDEIFEDPEFEIGEEVTGVSETLKWYVDEMPYEGLGLFGKERGRLGLVETSCEGSARFCKVVNMLAMHNPNLITRLFEPVENPLPVRPRLCVWLNTEGQFNPFFLDSSLPYHKETLEPLFSKCAKQQQVWPMLLEKGIAKSLGDYQKLKTKNYEDLIKIITGMPTKTINLVDRPDRAWRNIVTSIDNGSLIFVQNQSQTQLAYIENYNQSTKTLTLKLPSTPSTFPVPLSQLLTTFHKLYICNLQDNYHFNYRPLTLTSKRTLSTDIELGCKSHVVIMVESRELTNRGMSLCVYRVQEQEILRLVAEMTAEAKKVLWVEAVLRKGVYKVFVSLEPLRLMEADPDENCEGNVGLGSERSQFKTQRNSEELNVMLTVASRENFKCVGEIEVLKKQGCSRIGNSDISYHALKPTKKQPSNIKVGSKINKKSKTGQISTPPEMVRRDVKFLTNTTLN